MPKKTFKTLLIIILFFICISNPVTTDDDCSPLGHYLITSLEYDCFFIVGSYSGPSERIGSFKLILQAYSEPFRKILKVGELSDHGDIALPDIEPDTFKDFLKCVYGCCDDVIKKLSFKECVKIFYIAEKYLVTQVKEKVISRLLQFSPLNLDNTFTALSNPVYLNSKELNKVIADQLSNNTREIFDDERFLSLNDKALMIIVKQDSINVPEIIVWKAVLKWGIHNSSSDNGKVIREKISPLLEFIRFCSMDLKEFYDSVIPANVLTSDEAIELSTSLVNNSCSHNISGICQDRQSRYVPQDVEQGQVAYLHFVMNVTEMIENYTYLSGPVELGGYIWNIWIGKKSSFLRFFISCNQSPKVKRSSSWQCRIASDYILVNQNHKLNLHHSGSDTFNNYGNSWGYESFIKWDDLLDPAKGFIKDNRITVMARVKLVSTY